MLTPSVLLIVANLVQPVAEPRPNVESSCRAAANLGMSDGHSFKACMQDEQEAKAEVARKWTSYRAAARARCSAEATIGGDASYVDLLECLEIDKSLSGSSAGKTKAGVAPAAHASEQ